MSGIQGTSVDQDDIESGDGGLERGHGPAIEIDASAAGPAISDTKPPGRRDAIIRIGIVVGVLFVVFGLILPRFIDYQQVIETLQGLTLRDYLVVSVFGVLAWIVTGAIFMMLIEGLGLIRGLEAYLILTGIGASIPLGPWNMAVVWVVIRGWGRVDPRRDGWDPPVRHLRSAEPVRPDVRQRAGADRRGGAQPRESRSRRP